MKLPQIIQGGMGIAISTWRLARAVASKGQLGVVSATAIDTVHARILQDGDLGGHLRSAYAKFPHAEMAKRVMDKWFSPAGRKPETPYRLLPLFNEKRNRTIEELTALSCFAEIELGHNSKPDALIGINLLDKIRIPQLASLYGAMLAGVDYVLMGAGIPRHVPGVLDKFAEGQPASVKFELVGGGEEEVTFDPSEFLGFPAPKLKRPKFLAIITSATLAISLAKKASGKVDGFVVETSIAGGHNAPPRGPLQLDANNEPVYGPRDAPEFDKIAAVGLPFWIGGGYASAKRLADARALGATGIQIGTAFAACEESMMAVPLKRKIVALAKAKAIRVFTDAFASPTGFPFKVTRVEGTLSAPDVYASRPRVCDMGYLRSAYRKDDGTIGFRCASEPVADYVRKGGKEEDTANRVCLCNGLVAACGLPQVRRRVPGAPQILGDTLEGKEHTVESMVSTNGDTLGDIVRFLKNGAESYSALDVIQDVLTPVMAMTASAVEAASASVATWAESVTESASHVVSNITDAVSNAASSMNRVATNVREACAAAATNVREAYNTAATNVREAYVNAANNVCETASTVSANVAEAANTAAENVTQAAENVVNNVAEALSPKTAHGGAAA